MLVSVYYFLPQPKGYLGVHSPPYGGGAGGRGTSMSFITYVIMTSVHYVILASVSLLLCLLHTQPLMSLCHSGFCLLVTLSFTYSAPYVFMSFWLLPPCYSVFTYSVHYVLLASVPLLPCLLHTQSLRSLCLLFLCYHVFTYSAPYVFMSFWLHKCKVFLLTSYFVGNL